MVFIKPINNPDKVYDGQYSVYEHANERNNFVGTEQLVEGEELIIDTYFTDEFGNIINPIDIGTYQIHVNTDKFSYQVFVNGVQEWTQNYEIVYEHVSFTITSKVITVSTYSSDKVYDGEELINYSLPNIELAHVNHYLVLDYSKYEEFATRNN